MVIGLVQVIGKIIIAESLNAAGDFGVGESLPIPDVMGLIGTHGLWT